MNETTRRPRAVYLVIVLAAFALVAAACGSETATTESDTTEAPAGDDGAMADDEMADDEMADDAMAGGHEHDGEVIEVPDGMAVPVIAIEVTPDAKAGHNLFIELENFEISPENASTDPVDGQGHMHLYVDGERTARFYNTEMHLGSLEDGEHEITVEVSANNHSAYAIDGQPIRSSATVTVEPSEHAHGEMEMHEVNAADAPTVGLEVFEDPKQGWNLHFPTEGIDLDAEAASSPHVDGQGHMHLYVDGVKLSRVYGEWWHLKSLTEGDHEITIELNGNDHAPYAVDGEPITATSTISVAAEQASAPATSDDDMSHDDDTDHDGSDDDGSDHDGTAMGDGQVIAVAVAGGNVDIASERVSVPLGSEVTVKVTSDVADEVHVHGYDLHGDVGPGEPAEVTFTAEVPGLFEVELESAKLFLFELAVE